MRGVYIVVLLSLVTACVTTTVYKDLNVVNADKLVGQIQMGFEYDTSQIPVVNYRLAIAEVVAKCRSWKYENAIPLEDIDTKCIKGIEPNCKRYAVVYTYQCLSAQEIIKYQERDLNSVDSKMSSNENTVQSSSL